MEIGVMRLDQVIQFFRSRMAAGGFQLRGILSLPGSKYSFFQYPLETNCTIIANHLQ
jgi:hypothetical protein